MRIAFFDLDRTLLAVNSGRLWLCRELKAGHVTRMQAARAALWLAGYSLGLARLEDAVVKAVGMLAGLRERDIRQRTHDFYQRDVRRHYRPGGLEAVKRHRARGDRLVLLTSSSSYLSELVVRDLGLDDYLCNRFEVDEHGVYTGRCVGRVCFGAGKLLHADAYTASLGVSLDACAFYTDSYSDVPVLERVGLPVAVNPDQRLRRLAVRRGWHVVDWGVPSGTTGLLADAARRWPA